MYNRQKRALYEKSDVSSSAKAFIIAGISIVFLIIIIFVFSNIYLAGKAKQAHESALKPGSSELREVRAHEIKVLNSYKMLDEQNGVVQIPIERAMKLLAEEAYEDSKHN